jgi:hypothetical protein
MIDYSLLEPPTAGLAGSWQVFVFKKTADMLEDNLTTVIMHA